MTCKEYFNSEEVKINLLKQMPPRDLLPDEKKIVKVLMPQDIDIYLSKLGIF
jgi:hypothetical protein